MNTRIPVSTYVQDVTDVIDRRARYVARMMLELDERGLDTDQIMSAIAYEDGLFKAAKADPVSGADDFVRSHLDNDVYRDIYRCEFGELTPERAECSIRYHREVEEWKKRLSDDQMRRLYRLATNYERGLANGLGLEMEMTQCAFEGDPVTQFVFTRKAA